MRLPGCEPFSKGLNATAAAGVIDGGLANVQSEPFEPFEHGFIYGRTDVCGELKTFIWGQVYTAAQKAIGRAASKKNQCLAAELDQYYTRLDIAAKYWTVIEDHLDTRSLLMVEPSAGDGAFFRLMRRGSIGIDVEPKYPGISKANFLEVTIGGGRDICFVGNPPFGKNSSLARKFFNHAAREAKCIAMILPSTFLKGGMQNKLNPYFHVIYQDTVPENGFRFEGKLCTVPATFMIWERRPDQRKRWPTDTNHPDFDFLPSHHGADFVIQRVGANAGTVHDDFGKSPKAHYFIKSARPGVRIIMEQLKPEFVRVAKYVAGNPSLAKAEIIALYRGRTERLAPIHTSLPMRVRELDVKSVPAALGCVENAATW